MRRASGWLLFGALLWAQNAPVDEQAKPGYLGGVVLDQTNGRPVKRAEVLLRPVQSGRTPSSTESDEHGRFEFYQVAAGMYSLSASRSGYLRATQAARGSHRLPPVFAVQPGEQMTDLSVRLRAAGVIAGTVKFTDAEPAIGVPVLIYREYHLRGQHGYDLLGRAQTNDRGEYRAYDLPPGNYFILAAYARPRPAPGVREQQPPEEPARPARRSYVSTFHPSSQKLVEALPVSLGQGTELGGIDVFLARASSAPVAGLVRSGVSGRPIRGANIALWQPDATDTPAVQVPVDVISDPQGGGFDIAGVTPGRYLLAVNAVEDKRRLSARQWITVGEAPIEEVEILVMPQRELSGKLRVEGGTETPLTVFRVFAEPRAETASLTSTPVSRDGQFVLSLVSGEVYDLFVDGGPLELYLKSAAIGPTDALAGGIRFTGDALPPLEIVMSGDSGQVRGQVSLDGRHNAVGATVMLMPEPARGRPQFYQTTNTDQYGAFQFPGVTPGNYTVLSWFDEPPCDVYDPDSAPLCRRYGASVEVQRGGSNSVSMKLSLPR